VSTHPPCSRAIPQATARARARLVHVLGHRVGQARAWAPNRNPCVGSRTNPSSFAGWRLRLSRFEPQADRAACCCSEDPHRNDRGQQVHQRYPIRGGHQAAVGGASERHPLLRRHRLHDNSSVSHQLDEVDTLQSRGPGSGEVDQPLQQLGDDPQLLLDDGHVSLDCCRLATSCAEHGHPTGNDAQGRCQRVGQARSRSNQRRLPFAFSQLVLLH
jgi:hypothetical protein